METTPIATAPDTGGGRHESVARTEHGRRLMRRDGLLVTKDGMTAAVLRKHARDIAGPPESPEPVTDVGGGGSS